MRVLILFCFIILAALIGVHVFQGIMSAFSGIIFASLAIAGALLLTVLILVLVVSGVGLISGVVLLMKLVS